MTKHWTEQFGNCWKRGAKFASVETVHVHRPGIKYFSLRFGKSCSAYPEWIYSYCKKPGTSALDNVWIRSTAAHNFCPVGFECGRHPPLPTPIMEYVANMKIFEHFEKRFRRPRQTREIRFSLESGLGNR